MLLVDNEWALWHYDNAFLFTNQSDVDWNCPCISVNLFTNQSVTFNTIFLQFYPGSKRPVWFIFTGMGSQWPGMGKSLLKLPIFAAAIEKCHRVLEPHGVDLIDVITSDNPRLFDNILNCFVGIAACQVIVTVVLGFKYQLLHRMWDL